MPPGPTSYRSRSSRRPIRSVLLSLVVLLALCTTVYAVSVVWTRTVNGQADGDDRAWGMALAPNGDLYVVGHIEVTGEGDNIWVRKYSAAGTKLWTRTVDGPVSGNDTAYAAAADSSGNLYAVGSIDVTGGEEDHNIWIRKYSSSGAKLWTRTIDGPAGATDRAYGATVDSSGNLYVVGYRSITSGNTNIWIRKYNSTGAKLWTRNVDGPVSGYDIAHGAAVDSAGNLFVVGQIETAGESYNMWIRKYGPSGTKLWTRTVDGPESDRDSAEGAAVDSAGNLYVVGFISVTDEVHNIWIRKYSPAGAKLWTRTVDGPDHSWDEAYGAAVDSNDAVYVTGLFNSDAAWVRKYSSTGAKRWTAWYTGPAGTAQSNAVAVNATKRVYVSGIVMNTDANFDTWIRKYSQ